LVTWLGLGFFALLKVAADLGRRLGVFAQFFPHLRPAFETISIDGFFQHREVDLRISAEEFQNVGE